jgi:Protein of unknown function (DUF2764)
VKPGSYFLVASLPDLSFDRPTPITTKDFLGLCAEHLPAASRRLLAAIDLFQSSASPTRLRILNVWFERERALRNELARLRAQRLGWDLAPPQRSVRRDAELTAVAVRILEHESPRAAEDELDRARWTFLESLEFGHYFDLETLALYGLKLRLLERRAVFNKERGRERLRAFVSLPDEMTWQACATAPEAGS